MGIDRNEFADWANGRPAGEVLEQFKNQLIIALIERLGGEIFIPVEEADEVPRGKVLEMEIVRGDKPGFRFKMNRKQ